MSATLENPLLAHGGLPRFPEIKPEHVVPGVRACLTACARRLEQLETELERATGEGRVPAWDELFAPLEQIAYEMQMTWGPASHLMGVLNSPELRDAYETVLPEVVNFSLRLSQSVPIYRALESSQKSEAYARLPEERRRILDKRLRDARHSGIGLPEADRERFNQIVNRLSKLSTQFSNNVLDSTKEFALDLREPADVAGLPPSLLALCSQNYNAARPEHAPESTAERGPWRVTLDLPVFMPFMQHARSRALRENLYMAYIQRASSGSFDNTPLIDEILRLRAEKARLLGYATHAELSLSEKMAGRVAEVDALLEDLRAASFEAGRADLEEIRLVATKNGQSEPIHQWDVAFWAERLRESRFNFTDEELKPYFPLPRVLDGLFALVERIFGVRVRAADGQAPVWHKDVRYFEIENPDGSPVAAFYLDPYSRPENKRGGAWMDECLVRRKTATGLERPVAYLICNSTPPLGDRPSLMGFREVETLFHEFGHGLQHMLTTVDAMDVSGINGVEWDAVELPSQFMENWCFQKDVIMNMTAHVETGAPLPADLFAKIVQARNFRAGSDMLRQLNFGMLDMELHHRFNPDAGVSVFEVAARIAEKTSPLPTLPNDRFLCSFSHIFAGGYSAGYYSYKWAEVMSADAFSAFEEVGLENAERVAETGRRFRDTVLALGGSRHPREVFTAFRGRAPSTEALLRHSGLLKRSA